MRASRAAGLLLVLIGLAINKWMLETYVIPDGVIASVRSNLLVVIPELGLVATGVFLLVRGPRWGRPSTGELILLAGSTLLAMAGVEAALRVMQPADPSTSSANTERREPPAPSEVEGSNFEAAADTGWRMKPNHTFQWTVETRTDIYAANAQGFRSPHDFSQPPAQFVGLAGDSFAWGLGVDYRETFGDRIEQAMSRPGLETRQSVFNVALPGFGIDQMWISVRTHLLPRKPRLVIVAFIDDDFSRSLTAYRPDEGFAKPRFVLDGGNLRPQTRADVESGMRPWLRSHSAAWRLIENATVRLRPFGEWWALNTALVDAIAADCQRDGVPVLFVRLPQIDGGPFPSLARHMQQRALDYIDLGSAGVEGLHFPEDRHLNARGHEYVAGKIVEWIRGSGVPNVPRVPGF